MGPQAPDPKAYYGYLFKDDKTPSDVLDALLRATAKYIATEIGDKDETILTPKKLAAFYRAAGGDYDRLFLEIPHNSISYIWSNIGCQHTLQPTENDFQPPSIPALTPRGFVRWEAVEILLDPASHVPFLQHAVQNWALKHPDNGTPFPAPLPADAFPADPDANMVRWHEDKLEALKAEGQAEETLRHESPRGTRQSRRSPRPASPRRTGPRRSDSSSEESMRGRRSERPRPSDVGSGVHYVFPGRPGARRPADSYFPTVDEENGYRRRSFSDKASPTDRRRSPELRTPRYSQRRQYSQPRVNPVIVSSSSEDDSPPLRARAKHGSDPALHKIPLGARPSTRRVPAGFASPKRGYSPGLRPPLDVDRRKSFPFGDVKDKLMHTVSGILAGSTSGTGGKAGERPRSSSRTTSHASSAYLRPDEYMARREVESDESEGEYDSSERGRRQRRELEKERERGRAKAVQRAKERERDRDARGRLKERMPDMYEDRPLRPPPKRASPYRRGGLHPEGVAKRDDWDGYEGSRERVRHDRRRRDAHAYRD